MLLLILKAIFWIGISLLMGVIMLGGLFFAFTSSLHVIDGEWRWVLGVLVGFSAFGFGTVTIKWLTARADSDQL